MRNLTYTTEVHSIDYGYLTVEYDYFEADDSVGLSETYDWFAYTTEAFEDEPAGTDVTYELTAEDQAFIYWFAYTVEAFEDEPAGTDVTYELSAEDQAFIYAQIKKHHSTMLEDFHA